MNFLTKQGLPSITPASFLIAGGDLRQVYLCKMLKVIGFDVTVTGFDSHINFYDADVIDPRLLRTKSFNCMILPLPVSIDGITLNTPLCKNSVSLSALTEMVKDGGIVFGGKFSPDVKDMFQMPNITVEDYLEREELNVLNAVPTAEGAIGLAIQELPVTIFGLKVLILGFGRISKVLMKILRGFGADITVAARKCSDLAWVETYGCKPRRITADGKVPISNYCISDFSGLDEFDLIFNTIPAQVLCRDALAKLKADALTIDLASKPGVDFDAARELGLKVIWALSLPHDLLVGKKRNAIILTHSELRLNRIQYPHRIR
ncbi:MAG: dipicolinate synthase subunit DpsA [Oscillospiraceae bacterium]|jgi:dipicolinate synthase subunit A|nr:dipicolinate synthase subunit DpsA [Oscillospiraceae bacterium]